MSNLITKGNSYTFWTLYGVKPCFKILDSAVGGTKTFFNSRLSNEQVILCLLKFRKSFSIYLSCRIRDLIKKSGHSFFKQLVVEHGLITKASIMGLFPGHSALIPQPYKKSARKRTVQ